jgi:hypothetical protein
LKPIENLQVIGAEHGPETYPLNVICAHPDCTEPVGGKHHCFPKSQLKGDYWWVAVHDGVDTEVATTHETFEGYGDPVPNVVGLCGSGTTGHHGDVEEHRAWIKLEDGVYVWWDRDETSLDARDLGQTLWHERGPLNPQPGNQNFTKPKRKRFKGDARRKRRTVSIRVPKDTEDGGEVWDEVLSRTKEKLIKQELYSAEDAIPDYEAVVAGLNDWLNS